MPDDRTLLEFFDTEFLTPELRGTESERSHRRAVEAFIAFAGPVATVDEVPSLLGAFRQWAIANRIGERPERLHSTVASIVNLKHPSPDKPPRPPAEPKRRSGKRPAFDLDDSPGTLLHLFRTGYRPRRLRGGSSLTGKQYEIQLRHFGRFLGRQPTLADLNEDTVAQFLDVHAVGRSAPTANKAYWCLRALWEHAARRRLVDEFPTLPPFREPMRIPDSWFIDVDIPKLLASCRQEAGQSGGVPLADWWTALVMFALKTGERRGAIFGIRMDGVNFDRGEVHVPAETRKRKTRDMLYRLPLDATEALQRIREPQRELLFPWPWSKETFYYRYTKILRRAELPTGRKHKTQKLRRTFASYLEAAGGNATAALGHKSRAVAIKSYLDPRICGGQNPADMLPAIPLPRKDENV